jgi:hypothetical protein
VAPLAALALAPLAPAVVSDLTQLKWQAAEFAN